MPPSRRRTTETPPPQPPLRLTVPRAQLEAELSDRIELGQSLAAREIDSDESLTQARSDYSTWNEYNSTLLKTRFTNDEIEIEYSDWVGVMFAYDRSFGEELQELRDHADKKVRRLISIKGRLSLYDEPPGLGATAKTDPSERATIFIVHGHDTAARLELQKFLAAATSLRPVVLHEQPNQGRTIIEKFEDHAGDAAFAVILLTADDEGRAADAPSLESRGRQNVVFEFGFFVGALGRERVVLLYESEVELPSDLAGLAYIELDAKGGWRLQLARELRSAGIKVDLNKAL